MPPLAKTARVATLSIVLCLGAAAALAQSPPSKLDRGHGLQTWQDPGYAALVSRCKTPPQPFGIPVSRNTEPPSLAFPGPSTAIPGVIAAGRIWKSVWAWEGNNVDGPIADGEGGVLVANNDAGNVMRLDPATGRAKIVHD